MERLGLTLLGVYEKELTIIYRTYTLRLTAAARSKSDDLWVWLRAREEWFYAGLEMVEGTSWRVITDGRHTDALVHSVAFADETAWEDYRRAVAERSRDPTWEARRAEQKNWYDIVDRQTLTEPPVQLGIRAQNPRANERAGVQQ